MPNLKQVSHFPQEPESGHILESTPVQPRGEWSHHDWPHSHICSLGGTFWKLLLPIKGGKSKKQKRSWQDFSLVAISQLEYSCVWFFSWAKRPLKIYIQPINSSCVHATSTWQSSTTDTGMETSNGHFLL